MVINLETRSIPVEEPFPQRRYSRTGAIRAGEPLPWRSPSHGGAVRVRALREHGNGPRTGA
jgi:hypothetical protein